MEAKRRRVRAGLAATATAAATVLAGCGTNSEGPDYKQLNAVIQFQEPNGAMFASLGQTPDGKIFMFLPYISHTRAVCGLTPDENGENLNPEMTFGVDQDCSFKILPVEEGKTYVIVGMWPAPSYTALWPTVAMNNQKLYIGSSSGGFSEGPWKFDSLNIKEINEALKQWPEMFKLAKGFDAFNGKHQSTPEAPIPSL